MCASATAPGEVTNVHHAYLSMLAFWKRKLFDPFRRRARIEVRVGEKTHETTLGQANFALWTYRTGVLAYVLGHLADIEGDMNAVAQKHKRERRAARLTGVRRKRAELTAAPPALCVAYHTPVRVAFDDDGDGSVSP